jgi:hypothetical protein
MRQALQKTYENRLSVYEKRPLDVNTNETNIGQIDANKENGEVVTLLPSSLLIQNNEDDNNNRNDNEKDINNTSNDNDNNNNDSNNSNNDDNNKDNINNSNIVIDNSNTIDVDKSEILSQSAISSVVKMEPPPLHEDIDMAFEQFDVAELTGIYSYVLIYV